MNITIQRNFAPVPATATVTPSATERADAASEPSRSSDGLVEDIVDRTYLSANFAASGLAGAVSGAGAWATTGLAETARTTGSAVSDIWRTEKFGPVLRSVAATGAVVSGVAAGLMGAPFAIAAGLFYGARKVDVNEPRQFTVGEAARHSYKEVSDDFNATGREVRKTFQELGDYKLKPGENPLEIPLVRLTKTLAVGTAAAAAGAGLGVASGVIAAGSETLDSLIDIEHSSLSPLGKGLATAQTAIGAAAHGTLFGIGTGWTVLEKSTSETWKHNSIQAGYEAGHRQASNFLSAAKSPVTALTEPTRDPQNS